jgi:hypothetical protein
MTTPGIVTYKSSQVLPTAYHVQDPMYVAFIFDGDKTHWSEPFKDKEEAENELRCMEKQISFELIKTMQDDGFYPRRSVILENQYQKGNCKSGCYNEVNG